MGSNTEVSQIEVLPADCPVGGPLGRRSPPLQHSLTHPCSSAPSQGRRFPTFWPWLPELGSKDLGLSIERCIPTHQERRTLGPIPCRTAMPGDRHRSCPTDGCCFSRLLKLCRGIGSTADVSPPVSPPRLRPRAVSPYRPNAGANPRKHHPPSGTPEEAGTKPDLHQQLLQKLKLPSQPPQGFGKSPGKRWNRRPSLIGFRLCQCP